MASYPKQVRDSFSCQVRHGRSKAQICLQKILNLISSRSTSLRPPERDETPNQSSFHPQFSKLGAEAEDDGILFCENSGFNFDLNIKLGSPLATETEDSNCPSVGGGDCKVCEGEKVDSMTPSADVSMMTEKSSVGECDLQEDVENFNRGDSSRNKDGEELEVGVEERTTESSEFAIPRVQSSEIEINGLSGDSTIETQEPNNPLPELRGDDCLHMLIEAANLISGEFIDYEPEPQPQTNKPSDNDDETATAKQTKRGHCWTVELYGDTSPVVRSKRGRSQVLPYRYRDSVVEPLNRLSRQRSSSFSTRRRSR